MPDLFLPVKVGLGEYMGRFKQSLNVVHNDTAAVQEFAGRPLARSIVFAPSRMSDALEDILSAWRKNTNEDSKAQSTAFLPMIAIAVARDYTPTSPSHGMMLGDAIDAKIPTYPDNRRLKLEVIRGQLRVQWWLSRPKIVAQKVLWHVFVILCVSTIIVVLMLHIVWQVLMRLGLTLGIVKTFILRLSPSPRPTLPFKKWI